ncbi:EF-hand domain-containing protein [Streptomyces millisiae]|uniref:EF-hand domain-containing protein n=1 Tax=Streptomyces millisiae TaxID=3075542 RepID=A0ABU2LHL4_9ACTN|nr:EF-hand domain-containing protein [Streptomyces sp. DSM 44918]MDT0317063.1 EF-hand domain-containing protein [Streptomyces sp. DSM 44918]
MTASHPVLTDSLLRHTLAERRIALVAWRLLTLQTAHPVVAAGMADWSTYRAHPWRRVEHTMDSGRRLFFHDREALRREVARLDRTHRRIRGTDPAGRAYTAEDPEVRTWVLVTLYETLTALRALSGDPFAPAELDRLYSEFRGVCKEFGLPDELWPATAADVPGYIDRTIRERLADGPEFRYMLSGILHEAPRPRRLWFVGPAWPVLRVLIARLVTTLTVADLPPALRERFGLRSGRGAALLSWAVHHGARHVMTRLPHRWRFRLSATPTPAAPTRPRRAGRPRRRDTRPVRLDTFFRQVLDQTGDGFIGVADLRAMAHNVCWPLELTAEREAEVHAAFDTWWRHLEETMDADGDGRIGREEFVAAAMAGVDRDPDQLAKGLHIAVRAMFRAADTDGDGHLCADEYRTLFGGTRVHPAELNQGFRELDADGDGQITEREFVQAFTDYFTARTATTPGTHMFGRP